MSFNLLPYTIEVEKIFRNSSKPPSWESGQIAWRKILCHADNKRVGTSRRNDTFFRVWSRLLATFVISNECEKSPNLTNSQPRSPLTPFAWDDKWVR